MDKYLHTKVSIGVILCRNNAITKKPEVLLVHKRYTYAYAEFIHGRYAPSRNKMPHVTVLTLLGRMSTEELLDVWSLNFEQMWYRIWLTHDKKDFYLKKRAKFQAAFMRDAGEGLRKAIQQTKTRSSPLWEIPKGRRLNARESDIICAIRELREETGVERNEYRFLPGVKRRVSYVSTGTRYVCIYYIAVANPRLAANNLPSHIFSDTHE